MPSFYDLVQHLFSESTATGDFDPSVYPHFTIATHEKALAWKEKYQENGKWVIPVNKEPGLRAIGRTDKDLTRWLPRKSGPQVAYLFGIHFGTPDTLRNVYSILWNHVAHLATTHNVYHKNRSDIEKDVGKIQGLASQLFYLITKAFHRPHEEWRYYFGKYYPQEYRSFLDSLQQLAEKILYLEPNQFFKDVLARHLNEVVWNLGSMDLFYVKAARRYL